MNNTNRYRWIMVTILFAGLLGLNVLWFIPSPLLTVIMADLDMNLAQGGLGMSIVNLMVALFGMVGGLLISRVGAKRSFTFGLWFMALGALATYFVTSYSGLFFTRLIIGIGFGLSLPVPGVIIMNWFSERERPYLNTVNSSLPYLATVITFGLTVPIYFILGNSWRMAIVVWGILLGIVALAWAIWGKDYKGQAEKIDSTRTKSLYFKMWQNREVRLLSIAEACDLWGFQFLTSMLPTYYTVEVGLSVAQASSLTAIFPVAGIIAGIGCGIWMSRVGLRRPFTWPLHIIIFVGTLLAINGTGFIRIMGIALAGFGNAGWAPALFTMPMEFKDMNAEKVGAVYAMMLSIGFLAAFISPWLGGWLAESISIHHTIFLFSFASLVAAVCTFMMKETGPAGQTAGQ